MARLHAIYRHMRPIWIILSAALLLVACEKTAPTGTLRVEAPGEGGFEIYRIANESPIQFVSEQTGRFNENISLAPGSYLVLADCSSETVIVYPGRTVSLVAHRLKFLTPQAPSAQDSFSIQCSRSDKTRSRQHLNGQYDLTMIHGKRDLLVGMVPMHIDFDTIPDAKSPRDLTYRLAAVQVDKVTGKDDASFFISPVNELIAATKYQRFGHWEFLLPGQYGLEVNGTRMTVSLAEDEKRIVRPALLKVTTSQDIDLDLPARIKGSPWLVEINTAHWLNFNEAYPVLPGTASLTISGSTQSIEVEMVEGAEIELKARSVTVHSGCAAGDLPCLGSRGVYLYLADEPYPFIESVSDIPILFIDQGRPILLGIDGSRDISMEIPATVRDRSIQLGYVKVNPQPQHKPGQMTDLVRVDVTGAPWRGHSLDINLERPTLMPLMVGTYQLEHYVSNTALEGDRRSLMRSFTVEAGRTLDLNIPVFMNEKRWAAYRKKHQSILPALPDEKPVDHAEIEAPKKPKAL